MPTAIESIHFGDHSSIHFTKYIWLVGHLVNMILRYLRKPSGLLLILCAALASVGCLSFAGDEETGVVLARRAQIRSSTAVVAADLLEVERGDALDILNTETADNGEKWLRVRARDVQLTEGWIESRNVMLEEMLARSRQLAAEDKDVPSQATGQLRASTNLRITADRSSIDNIMMKLESGASFEIVNWKRVPKPKSSESTDSDDAPKSGSAQGGNRRRREKSDNEAPEEENELWYKVRLSPAISPAPAGWVYGKQVELTVPSDIIFYRTGREFVAWQRLDDAGLPNNTARRTGAEAQDAQPGSWVILEKSSSEEGRKIDAPDFDRIFVLGYDKAKEEHYTAYRSPDLRGRLPMRVEGRGDAKYIVVNVIDADGKTSEARYKVVRDNKGALKIEPPPDAAKTRRR